MKRFAVDSDLVIDLGMNNGDDTAYYLARGFRVAAVEANPTLCAQATHRFADVIAQGRLTIFNAAISAHAGPQTFYVNRVNDHWSSLDAAWAGREGHALDAVVIDGLTVAALFARVGVPYYLKVDVEGADELVLDQLIALQLEEHLLAALRSAEPQSNEPQLTALQSPEPLSEGVRSAALQTAEAQLAEQLPAAIPQLPQYLSVEDCRFGFRYLQKMAALGYTGFQLVDQSQVPMLADSHIDWRFAPGASGPFGEALPGQWLDAAGMDAHYSRTVRDRDGHRHAPRTHWWDIHARGTACVTPAEAGAQFETDIDAAARRAKPRPTTD